MSRQKKTDNDGGKKPRKTRGEGSVFQRESDGRWVASVPIGSGKKQEYYDTKAQAERARRRMLHELEQG